MKRALIIALLALGTPAHADDEVSLFDGKGRPSAYIAEDLTIYLWSGKPVAYLERDSGAPGFHIYGFNGKHLGWFVGGVTRDHEGDGACAVKEVLRQTEFEPFRPFKEFKPFKSFKEFAPFRPFFSRQWSDTPCRFFLGEGAS